MRSSGISWGFGSLLGAIGLSSLRPRTRTQPDSFTASRMVWSDPQLRLQGFGVKFWKILGCCFQASLRVCLYKGDYKVTTVRVSVTIRPLTMGSTRSLAIH